MRERIKENVSWLYAGLCSRDKEKEPGNAVLTVTTAGGGMAGGAVACVASAGLPWFFGAIGIGGVFGFAAPAAGGVIKAGVDAAWRQSGGYERVNGGGGNGGATVYAAPAQPAPPPATRIVSGQPGGSAGGVQGADTAARGVLGAGYQW